MIFYFLISIVFIAELIIAITLVLNLIKLDKVFIKYNELLDSAKPSIKELLITVRKISEQLVEFAPIIVENIKSALINIVMGQVKNTIGALTFWLVKKEVEKQGARYLS